MTLEQLFDRFKAGDVKELRLILKADVQGSLEPIVSSIKELSKSDIAINVLYAETGNVGENDVMLAAASKAIVIGFNVQADAVARRLADAEGVSIRLYNIIYRLTEDLEKALKGMLEPEEKQIVIGHAEVRAIFRISKIGHVAGCRVSDGELRRNAYIRVLRSGLEVYSGPVSSLRHLQDDVKEVRQGYECGVAIKGFAWKAGNPLPTCASTRTRGARMPASPRVGTTASDTGESSDVTIIGNIIYDCDHPVLAKQGNFFTLLHNTIVRQTHEGGRDTEGAVACLADNNMAEARAGAYFEGNILHDIEALTRDHTNAMVTFTNNLIGGAGSASTLDNTNGNTGAIGLQRVSNVLIDRNEIYGSKRWGGSSYGLMRRITPPKMATVR